MRRLKNIVLYHRALLGPGGAERLLLEEYNFLRRRGIEARILSFRIIKKALFEYKNLDIEVLPGNNYVSQTLALRERLREIEPDLVRCLSGYIELFFATRLTNIPYVLQMPMTMYWFPDDLMKYALIHRRIFNKVRTSVIGHMEFTSPKPEWTLKQRLRTEVAAILDYLAVRKAKEVLVLSPQMRWEVQQIYRRDAVVLRGAISQDLLNYKSKNNMKERLGLEDKRIILSVSRLDPRKRVDVVIKAFFDLISEMEDVFLIVVGTGPDESRLKKLTRNLKLQGKVLFTGYVKDEELWDYYASCDVFATPAWADYDITPFEALALQKSVVWSSEMAQDLLKDEHVIVADPNPRAFAEGIKKALDTDPMCSLDLAEYTWESYFTKILNIYQDIVEGD